MKTNTDGESTAVGPKPTSADKKDEALQNRSREKENKSAKERERSAVKPQSSKIDKRAEHREETRTSSSKTKRSPSLKKEKESDSETENLQLPPISLPANETSIGEKSRNNSSLMVATPEGESETTVRQNLFEHFALFSILQSCCSCFLVNMLRNWSEK